MQKYLILSLALVVSIVGLQSCDRPAPPPPPLDQNGRPLPPPPPPQVPLDQNGRPTPPPPPPAR